jgi:hypothetical protein
VDLHEVASLQDQAFGELLTVLAESAVSDVALPEIKHFINQVVLEELHTCEDVEHRALECPLGEGQEFSRHGLLVALALFVLVIGLDDLDYTLGGDGEVLCVELLLIFDDFEIVRAEFAGLDLASVAVQKFDRHGDSVLGEEGDGVGASLDTILEVPDGGPLLDEVSLGKLLGLVVVSIFLRSNE